MLTRRQFNKSLAFTALSGLALNVNALSVKANMKSVGFGKIINDPNKILSLPEGFSYTVISRLGDSMDDGLSVPDRADGMGCFGLDSDRVALVRNHELQPQHVSEDLPNIAKEQAQRAYDRSTSGVPLPGGTSNIVYNLKTRKVEQQYMSLLGTIRNCAGGITPWGTWLSCEESVNKASDKIGQDHGYVFEVPATANGLVQAHPLKDMGRFNHEAACVDPETGIVYLTEDRNESLFYRFIPKQPGKLSAGGKLQALVVKDKPKFDTRNWLKPEMKQQVEYQVEWIDLDDVTSPKDDLRKRGHEAGAALFARGEGIIFGENELYFCCTSGGAQKLGQIMRYSINESKPTLNLFLESEGKSSYNYGDNICIAPNGHLIVCEDQYSELVDNHVKGVTQQGAVYDLARVELQTEPAGACFSPDGKVMFINLYSPTLTLAVTGPWDKVDSSLV